MQMARLDDVVLDWVLSMLGGSKRKGELVSGANGYIKSEFGSKKSQAQAVRWVVL
jgi:hypothetical protein